MSKEYACAQFNYEAKVKSILRNHQHVFHERKRFKCDKCDFQSSSKGHLKKSQGTHSNLTLSFKWGKCDWTTCEEAW